MFKKRKNGYYVLDKFTKQLGLVHGFSTREFGDLKVRRSLKLNKNLDKFLPVLGIDKEGLVMMEQVHDSKIKAVGKRDKGKVIKGVDGLITKEKGIFLGVNTADCLPLLFCDPKKKIVGLAHAGWKGILAGVTPKVVEEMKTVGSSPKDTMIGIGPHIRGCCYTIPQARAEKFLQVFTNLPGMIYEDKEGLHLDLMVPVIKQLLDSGVRRENIETALTCTSCQNNEFFSFRRENKRKTYGEMLGVIGWI